MLFVDPVELSGRQDLVGESHMEEPTSLLDGETRPLNESLLRGQEGNMLNIELPLRILDLTKTIEQVIRRIRMRLRLRFMSVRLIRMLTSMQAPTSIWSRCGRPDQA